MSTAVKYDGGKPPVHLIPPEAIFGTAEALAVGEQKYGARNWEKGLMMSRVFAAAIRHLWAWWGGEDADPESGISHLHHAGACVMMLQAYTERNRKDLDDRYDAAAEKAADDMIDYINRTPLVVVEPSDDHGFEQGMELQHAHHRDKIKPEA